jgi:hypothetical protein
MQTSVKIFACPLGRRSTSTRLDSHRLSQSELSSSASSGSSAAHAPSTTANDEAHAIETSLST